MTQRYIALLRGINVGRANRVAMADLRAVVTSLGYTAPRTVLNSGNVVFTASDSSPHIIAARLEQAFVSQLGVTSRATVLPTDEFAAAIAGNPLVSEARDPSRLLVAFLREASETAKLESLAQQDWRPELVALGERVAYTWCPEGVTGSPLLLAIAKVLGDSVTTRNWATVLRLQRVSDTGQ